MERYTFKVEGDKCCCIDNRSGLICSFDKGHFNTTQHFNADGVLADFKRGGAGVLARLAGDMGNWLAHNAREEVGDE